MKLGQSFDLLKKMGKIVGRKAPLTVKKILTISVIVQCADIILVLDDCM